MHVRVCIPLLCSSQPSTFICPCSDRDLSWATTRADRKICVLQFTIRTSLWPGYRPVMEFSPRRSRIGRPVPCHYCASVRDIVRIFKDQGSKWLAEEPRLPNVEHAIPRGINSITTAILAKYFISATAMVSRSSRRFSRLCSHLSSMLWSLLCGLLQIRLLRDALSGHEVHGSIMNAFKHMRKDRIHQQGKAKDNSYRYCLPRC